MLYGISLSGVNYFCPKYFLAIILKRQWAHKRKRLLQVRRFRQCQCRRSEVRPQQILPHRVTQHSRTTPGRHQDIDYAVLTHIGYQADHGHTQVCGIADLLTHIFSYGDLELCNGVNKNSGPKHTGAISAPDPSSGRILYIPLFLQGRTGLGRTSPSPTHQSEYTEESKNTALRI